MKLHLVALCFLIAQTAMGQSTNSYVDAGLATLAINSHQIHAELGLYIPTDADLARFVSTDSQKISEFKTNTMGLSTGKYAQYIIANVAGREVLLRSSSIFRNGVFTLKASGGLMTEEVPGNEYLKELQGARGDDTLKIELIIHADGSFSYDVRLKNMWNGADDQRGGMIHVDDQVFGKKNGKLKSWAPRQPGEIVTCNAVFRKN
ncbi:hypothetical protein [Bdellovibrio sp. HCB274]|uniref:hypothetical protein n=1 Tax=Bdellovibrio sp. HCB274 TaxID=3394361 RepID=UPI0039B5D757